MVGSNQTRHDNASAIELSKIDDNIYVSSKFLSKYHNILLHSIIFDLNIIFRLKNCRIDRCLAKGRYIPCS